MSSLWVCLISMACRWQSEKQLGMLGNRVACWGYNVCLGCACQGGVFSFFVLWIARCQWFWMSSSEDLVLACGCFRKPWVRLMWDIAAMLSVCQLQSDILRTRPNGWKDQAAITTFYRKVCSLFFSLFHNWLLIPFPPPRTASITSDSPHSSPTCPLARPIPPLMQIRCRNRPWNHLHRLWIPPLQIPAQLEFKHSTSCTTQSALLKLPSLLQLFLPRTAPMPGMHVCMMSMGSRQST